MKEVAGVDHQVGPQSNDAVDGLGEAVEDILLPAIDTGPQVIIGKMNQTHG
jgi:hypothetical protein